MRTVYVNGTFVPENQAHISVFDRGFLMSDSVYEVFAVIHGRLLEFEAHVKRLAVSLAALSIPMPIDFDELRSILVHILEDNQLEEGVIYLQVTRGEADRDFLFPSNPVPGVVVFSQAKDLISSPHALGGIRVVTLPDIRWGRCDIKTTQLLAACMAKAEARRLGADDAWLVKDGMIMEGTSSNAFIIDRNGTLITRCLSNEILHGITRKAVLKLAESSGIRIEERPFSTQEACEAAEALISSASTFVWPVVSINGIPIGSGKPGPITESLRQIYLSQAREDIDLCN